MTDGRRDDQLDVPLVWERGSAVETSVPGRAIPSAGARRPGVLRLALVAGVDLGHLLSCIGVAWGVGELCGARLDPLQLTLSAVVGLEVAGVIAWGCLWAWRGTPGMLLSGLCFDDPLPFGRAGSVWLWWSVATCMLGLPLAVRFGGTAVVERLAGSALSSR
jgi:hypothetical protein